MDRRRRLRRPERPPRRKEALDLDDVIYGIHAIEEALAGGEELRRVYVGEERKRDPALRKLLEHASVAGVPVRYESRSFFSQFPYRAHQSVVGFGQPFDYVTLDHALALDGKGGRRLYVVLDHITDPHNAGAIIRSAECAGATAIVLPERRAAGVNATVRKAAAGATAHIPIAHVANVAGALREMKQANVWVAGAAVEGAQLYTTADFRRDLAIVIGAEGAGISPVVRKECDYLVRIPVYGAVGSLNASVAAGILLYEVQRQRQKAP